ncbi:MAG: hypothetical protein IJ242_17735, partial [Clostridia bacterium]|nr:hypothetical protein [Clostridia bacterium]
SITMTVFYVLLYYILLGCRKQKENRNTTNLIWILAAVRIILCLFPQNAWLENKSDVTWGIIRNVPFVTLGGIICRLYYEIRNEYQPFRNVWVYILLSFLFYIPVAVAAGIVPMFGMLMLPKTVCYILMICAFLRAV